MSQFSKVFSVCRIPGEVIDSIRMSDFEVLAKHIIVTHNNHVRFISTVITVYLVTIPLTSFKKYPIPLVSPFTTREKTRRGGYFSA